MAHIIMGLGNPGEEYANTRHSVGRTFVMEVREKYGLPDWKESKGRDYEISKGRINGIPVMLVLLGVYMNSSGRTAKLVVPQKFSGKKLIFIHDDLDLPLGKTKLAFNRGPAGHKGVISVIRALKRKDFYRIRIGISPLGGSGQIKKVKGTEKVKKLVLSEFAPKERSLLKEALKSAESNLLSVLS